MIAVVIPCHRVRDQILDVLEGIGEECDRIYMVDDACPEATGDHVEKQCSDPRVRVLRHAAKAHAARGFWQEPARLAAGLGERSHSGDSCAVQREVLRQVRARRVGFG